jgi:hypothetical protein
MLGSLLGAQASRLQNLVNLLPVEGLQQVKNEERPGFPKSGGPYKSRLTGFCRRDACAPSTTENIDDYQFESRFHNRDFPSPA